MAGEWFDIDPYEAVDLVRAVVSQRSC